MTDTKKVVADVVRTGHGVTLDGKHVPIEEFFRPMTADERAVAIIKNVLWSRIPGFDAALGDAATAAIMSALTAASLAIIDTRTHRPVRVHTFDKDDPETWPKTELAPSSRPWATIDEQGYTFFRPFHNNVATYWGVLLVTGYYDPADLTGGA